VKSPHPNTTETIDQVVASSLCTRCGACVGVCPHKAITWDRLFFPQTNEKCNHCGICLKVCGGKEVDFPGFCRLHYGKDEDLTANAIGPLRYSVATCCTDEQVRQAGSSGGLASQIVISLLAQSEIDGAVMVGFAADNPLRPEARIVRNREEVLACAQSKYTLFPVAHVYGEIAKVPGKYAVVGLPCQIHSLFRWMDMNHRLRERVVLIIGLFCHANLGPEVVGDVLGVKGLSPEDIGKFEFRGGTWPGGIRAHLRDGTIIPLHKGDIKDGAFNYLNKLYIAERCLLCTDFSAELSDIAVSDPWLRDPQGNYLFQGGWSVGHVRTERGHLALRAMIDRGELESRELPAGIVEKNNRSLTHYKKRGVFIRLERRRLQGRPVPEYHLTPPPLAFADRSREFVHRLSLLGRRPAGLRRMLLRFGLSDMGWHLGRCKAHLKKWNHRLF
jgi:coenzyme F420 hydrogenase subunit beta